MQNRMRLKARDLRAPDNVAEAVHAIFGGRPSSTRIPGTIARCSAPAHERARCGGVAYQLTSRPGVWACTAEGCRCPMAQVRRPDGRVAFEPRDFRHDGYLHGPALVVAAERLTRIEPLARHFVRRYLQEASAGSDALLSAAARWVMAPAGSEEERRAEAEIDASLAKHTFERIQAHRATCQHRLYRHVAGRFKSEKPWLPRCSCCQQPVVPGTSTCREHAVSPCLAAVS